MAGIIPAAGAVSSGSRFRRRRYTPIADINVTPLVDVMLVLLIIFMITAPLLQVGVPVDLPKTSAQQVGGKDEPMVVSVNSQGEVFLGETKYEFARARHQAEGGARGETGPACVHARRQGRRLRQDDGSDGRGDRQRLPPARPPGRAGAAARQGRRRHRVACTGTAPAPRGQPQQQPTPAPVEKERRSDRWTTASSAVSREASKCARRPSCRRCCMSSCWGRR